MYIIELKNKRYISIINMKDGGFDNTFMSLNEYWIYLQNMKCFVHFNEGIHSRFNMRV